MAHDPLSDIVNSLSLTGAVFLRGELTAPWAIRSQVTKEDCRPFLPVPKHVIAFHFVMQGEVLLSTDKGLPYTETLTATAGDVIVLPTNASHILASDLGLTVVRGDDLLIPASPGELVHIQTGGGGAETHIYCGFLAGDGGANLLLESLPPALIVQIDDESTQRWIAASIAMASQESSTNPAVAQSLVGQLSEMMLLKALRQHIATVEQPQGWLAAIADPQIGRAICFVHAHIGSPLAVTQLATVAGMSRSAFVDRFATLTGKAPSDYILNLRINKARDLLASTELSLAEIAQKVGYSAPEAFSRAFKRETHKSPKEWRAAILQ